MNQKLFFPAFSLISLLFYFAVSDIFTSSFAKYFVILISFIFVSSDLINIQMIVQDLNSEEKRLRIESALLGLFALVVNQIRNFIDFPSVAGVAEQASFLPKLRDFLLLVICIATLSFIVITIIVLISKDPRNLQTSLRTKKMTLLKNTLFGFFAISPILIAVNYFAVMKNYNFDLSSIGKFSFSTTSRQILKDVKKEIIVTAFFPRPLEGESRDEGLSLSYIRPEVEILLDQLKNSNPLISIKFVNAEVEKELMGDYTNVSNGIILLRSLKTTTDSTSNPYNEERVTVQNKKDLEDIERKLIQGVINVSTPRKKVYFTVSNGERYGNNFQGIQDEQLTRFVSILSFYNYSVNELGFSQGWPNKIPEDADVLFIIGPTVAFNEIAIKTIEDFIARKGKLFISVEPSGDEEFSWLLNKAGLHLKKENLRQVEGRTEVLANKFQTHPIEELIIQKEKGILFLANAYFEPDTKIPPSFNNVNILETGFSSFADLNKNSKMDKEEKQNSYPIISVLSDRETEADKKNLTPVSPSRIIISSGTAWLTNRLISYNLNSIFAINSVNWLNQSVLTEKILLKKEEVEIVTVSDKQKLIIWLVGLFIFPIGITLIFGFYASKKRKS